MDVLWPDAQIESVCLEYDLVRLTVRESVGHVVVVEGHGPLGLELAGLWDETIVQRAQLVADDPFARRCWDSVKSRFSDGGSDSGSPDRNTRTFKTLVVTLIDGGELRVAAARFETLRARDV